MSELKRKAALREVSVKASPVNDGDDLDALFGGDILEEKAIAEITNMLRDDADMFLDDWSLGDNSIDNPETIDKISGDKNTELLADRDRLQKELESLRSQHEFECEYVDQLEKEIISATTDRNRQATELNVQIEQLQCQNTALDISQQSLTKELESAQRLLKESAKTIEIAQAKLSEVRTQRDQFEEELIQHLSNQAQMHQSLRGFENEYVSDLTRVQELEQQIEELQNHVFQQAAKASEYEAAVQHWKEQSVRHQHHALQLSGALDRLLEEKPVKHLTPSIQQSNESTYEHEYRSARSLETLPEARPENVPVRSHRPSSKVDLPSFLVRHR
ncbi:MAG: hypothetical protein LH649_11010 [Pseudanabaena sp. CAN_BIN31]|nr:hypothetical protein [Pseudanabaena sp. CAN_BIN31]